MNLSTYKLYAIAKKHLETAVMCGVEGAKADEANALFSLDETLKIIRFEQEIKSD